MTKQFELLSLSTRMATEEDDAIPSFDHTKLSAINTCPTWGVVRYVKHLRMPGAFRSMALEAGAAAHESFAAIKWYQFTRQCNTKAMRYAAERHGFRLFGEDRFPEVRDSISSSATDRTNLINVAITALENSGFYDDISDTKRTISNISEALICYVDQYDLDRFPIWIRDDQDRETDIGIEIPFNIVVTFEYKVPNNSSSEIHERTYRFTGKLDGLQYNKDALMIREEKTGSRLDDSWLAQWILSHQITGYCIAAATFTDLPCWEALISGMRIPVGRDPTSVIRTEHVPRNEHMVEKWAEWFIHSADMALQFIDSPLDAPMYTHSCNRYFNSCSFMPLCACSSRDEKEQVLSEMEFDEWSPLDD